MIEKLSNIDTKPANEIGGSFSDVSYNKLDTSKPLDFSRPDGVGCKLDNTKLDTSRAQDYSNDLERKETLEQLKQKYLEDLLAKTEYPETIDIEKAMKADFRKCSPEDKIKARAEFSNKQVKNDLIRQWEEKNGVKWPRNKEDVYDDKGHFVRKAGDRYDAHHIQPIEMGGKNEVDNITPLRADVHYDAKGVHKIGSPFNNLEKHLGLKQ